MLDRKGEEAVSGSSPRYSVTGPENRIPPDGDLAAAWVPAALPSLDTVALPMRRRGDGMREAGRAGCRQASRRPGTRGSNLL